jgi:hypothetical protein
MLSPEVFGPFSELVLGSGDLATMHLRQGSLPSHFTFREIQQSQARLNFIKMWGA